MERINRKSDAQAVVIYFPCSAPINLYTEQFKRIVDLTVASIALCVCAPILVLACIAIRLETAGNPIFRQRRAGANGEFEILKLRTMRDNSEHEGFVTTENDQRITRVGTFLRATKIDELPQLINILKGDMSVVGPRPLSITECEHIEGIGIDSRLPGFYPRVRPGLVGIEQLNRDRAMSYIDRFKFNAEYERFVSFSLDAKILFKSFFYCRQVSILSALALVAELIALVAIARA